MSVNGKPLKPVKLFKNSRLLNASSTKAISCVDFMESFEAVISCARTFDESYTVPFQKARLYDVGMDMKAAKFIPGSSPTVYRRYIRLPRMYLRHPGLLPLIFDFNKRAPCRPNNSISKITVKNLTYSHLEQLDEHKVLFCVEGEWYVLNAKAPKARAKTF